MKNNNNRKQGDRPTRVEKLRQVLEDRAWHPTSQLVKTVGHTFGMAKFRLVEQGVHIEVRRHPTKLHQFEYRLVKPAARLVPVQ